MKVSAWGRKCLRLARALAQQLAEWLQGSRSLGQAWARRGPGLHVLPGWLGLFMPLFLEGSEVVP